MVCAVALGMIAPLNPEKKPLVWLLTFEAAVSAVQVERSADDGVRVRN
jgi:hypothetical protein